MIRLIVLTTVSTLTDVVLLIALIIAVRGGHVWETAAVVIAVVVGYLAGVVTAPPARRRWPVLARHTPSGSRRAVSASGPRR